MTKATRAALLDVAEILHAAEWDRPQTTEQSTTDRFTTAAEATTEAAAVSASNFDDEDKREFIDAVQLYMMKTGGERPTWEQVFEILRGLGYSKSPASPPSPSFGGFSQSTEIQKNP